MSTYKQISEELKAGLSKIECFEKLNTEPKKAKSLAEAIASFPSSPNYVSRLPAIKSFFNFFMFYSVILFSYMLIELVYKQLWMVLAVAALLVAGCFFIFSFARRGVLQAMIAMLIFPLIKTIELGVDHISVIMAKSDVLFSPSQVVLHYITSAFFLYSLGSLIYGIKVIKDTFHGEKFIGRLTWDSTLHKPHFEEESKFSSNEKIVL